MNVLDYAEPPVLTRQRFEQLEHLFWNAKDPLERWCYWTLIEDHYDALPAYMEKKFGIRNYKVYGISI